MQNRPIGVLTEALLKCGAEIEYLGKVGFPPLSIQGRRLKGGEIELDGGVSSQYISALLMIAPCMEKGLVIQLKGEIVSRPYIRMTLGLMEQCGIKAQWVDSVIKIKPQTYIPYPCRIERDWSAASYWYEIRALASGNAQIELPGLERHHSLQGDAKVEDLFDRLLRREGVFRHDFIDEPDLAQTLAVSCCLLNIPFVFTGLQSLRIKETDRLSALQTELRKLGYVLRVTDNHSLQWLGERCEADPHPVIATYEDHRMALSFAPVCLKTGVIQIADPEVVTKSYPHYWNDLVSAGFTITPLA
jgi:3-phosphoshikimate 1-carboxyvinyltransferase